MSTSANNLSQLPVASKQIRFLALGDSYTIGEAVAVDQCWPVQLTDTLSKSGFNMAWPEIIAKTGWTTSELSNGIQEQNPNGPYHLVSLLIGVNNQYRKLDTAAYRSEFRQLLQLGIEFAGDNPEKVIVVSIPDYSVTPFAQNMDTAQIKREIDIFNAINVDESKKRSVISVDVTAVSRKANIDHTLLAEDGLHPSAKMYSKWVELIYPLANQILQNHTR